MKVRSAMFRLVSALLLLFICGTDSAWAKTPDRKYPQKTTKKVYKPVKYKSTKYKSVKYKSTKRVYFVPTPRPVVRPEPAPNTPLAQMERVGLQMNRGVAPLISPLPQFSSRLGGQVASLSRQNDFIFYSIDPALQRRAQELIDRASAPHAAIVAMEPTSGRILAIAEKSPMISNLAMHAGFPAASLFKLVTTAAALENGAIQPSSLIAFRGGTYTLNQWNFLPDARKDHQIMSVAEALGKSCNPVFARIALKHLSPKTLRFYAQTFGFDTDLGLEAPLSSSHAVIPEDSYGLSRTAAGFGDVRISPVHAAAIMSGIANHGMLPKPRLVERVLNSRGDLVYQARTEIVRHLTRTETANTLLNMMENTTTLGTSRREFSRKSALSLAGIKVAAKTGTLKGTNPPGLNNWFIAAAPIQNPRIAVSVIVVDPRGLSSKASYLGREMIEKYLKG
ncbi:MAG: hypothetical protein K1X83_10900 [Oligoflexia bacterium]|nr:hypothetical protein [Oligoflexia bacterium]